MAGMSKFVESLPEDYGYVVLAGVGSVILNIWMAMNVGKARKQYEVKFPLMYHPEPNHVFNCIQRAHQNTLEGSSYFLFLLMTSGLQYPKCSAAAGAVGLLGRIFYAKGYYTGDPQKRSWGGFGHIATPILLGGAISLAVHQLGWWPCNK